VIRFRFSGIFHRFLKTSDRLGADDPSARRRRANSGERRKYHDQSEDRMQASERGRLIEVYRDELAGKVALGCKCAALGGALALIVAIAATTANQSSRAGSETTSGSPQANEGDAFDPDSSNLAVLTAP
jgi:hypothetical protein